MKMRAGGPARASTAPNLLPCRYPLALLYLDLRQVEVEREQSLPVIEYHAISFEVQGARQQNDSRISGGNRCTGGDAVVQSLVHALNFAVKGPAGAKGVGDRGDHGWKKPS